MCIVQLRHDQPQDRAREFRKTDMVLFDRRDQLLDMAKLLRERHSTRSFDDQRPITVAELSRLLDSTPRVLSRSNSKLDLDDGGHAVRPYPSAGGGYELELYLAVGKG